MLALPELYKQSVEMVVGATARLTAFVAEDSSAPCVVRVEGGRTMVIQYVHSGERQFVEVEPVPGIARVAIDDGL